MAMASLRAVERLARAAVLLLPVVTRWSSWHLFSRANKKSGAPRGAASDILPRDDIS
jgi:hypothetical protein